MPKAFSDGERAIIQERLEAAAETVMKSGSIRKASVEELAAGAGISKGAFYLFYPSKELLFFSVIKKKRGEIESLIVARLAARIDPGKADVTAVLLECFRATYESFIPRLMSGGELGLLMRRIPAETVAAHRIDDADFLGVIADAVPALSAAVESPRGNEIAAFCSSALRAVFLLASHRAEIGEDQFDRVVTLFVEGIVEKLFEGTNHD